MAVFFLLPLVGSGARYSLREMKNDVRDWLPSSFRETHEMAWFWRHFVGEQFIVISWAGCSAENESYKLLLEKLRPPVPPSKRAAPNPAPGESGAERAATSAAATTNAPAGPPVEPFEDETHVGTRHLERPRGFLGDELNLLTGDSDYQNWGGRQEKWLLGDNGQWYFLTPEGDLYRGTGSDAPLAALAGRIWRRALGGQVPGEFVAAFGPVDGPWYYEDTVRLNAQLFHTVMTGPDVLAHLTNEGGVLADNSREAARRLRGLLFGPDGKQTCMVLTLTPNGLRNLHRVLGRGMLGRSQGRLLKLAEQSGVTSAHLHLGGPPVDNVAIDEEGTITLVRLVALSALLGVVLTYACFGSIPATVIVLFVGGIGAVLSLAMVGWCGATLDAVLMSMPSLVYVLGISGAVHLINYYRGAVEEHGLDGACEKAISHGWKPALFCNVTTAVGLLSLYTSDLIPIRKFGIFSALGVMVTLALLFLYLPSALQIWPLKICKPVRRDEPTWYEKRVESFSGWFCSGILNHHYTVFAVCVAVIAAVGYGVTRINTSINLMKLFDDQAKILQDYAWLEKHLGKLVPMEVVVKFHPDVVAPAPHGESPGASPHDERAWALSLLERMELIDRIQGSVDEAFGEEGSNVAGHSLSAVTFAPELPPRKGDTLTYVRRNATNAALESHHDELLKSDYLKLDHDDGSELWRISLRLAAMENIDYGQFVYELQHSVEPVLSAERTRQDVLKALAGRRALRQSGSRVCIVGLSISELTASAAAAAPTTAAAVGAHADDASSVNAQRTFGLALRDALKASRLQIKWLPPVPDADAAQIAQALGQFDCVVLVRGADNVDLAAIRQHGALVVDAREHYDEALLKRAAAGDSSVSVVYTGLVPIVYKAQRTLLNSLIQSTFWSFITITPLMMFVSRGIGRGAVAMLPNVLPVLVIFGAMGWLKIQVDIGSMMTASIALGIAVDDTIHFLTWFREELEQRDNRKEAILATYRRCATPTLQAAIISGLGLSIFAFSTFTPTQRFGYLMLTILLAGVVAELVFFPAILAGPLGNVFHPRRRRPGATAVAASTEAALAFPAGTAVPTPSLAGGPDLQGRHHKRTRDAARRTADG